MPLLSPLLQLADRLRKMITGFAFAAEKSALLAEVTALGRFGVEGTPGLMSIHLLPSSQPAGLDAGDAPALAGLVKTTLTECFLGVERLTFSW